MSKTASAKAAISDWTGIPVGKMVQDKAQILLDFEARLGKRIQGEDHVLGIVGNGVRAAKAGLKNPQQPARVIRSSCHG